MPSIIRTLSRSLQPKSVLTGKGRRGGRLRRPFGREYGQGSSRTRLCFAVARGEVRCRDYFYFTIPAYAVGGVVRPETGRNFPHAGSPVRLSSRSAQSPRSAAENVENVMNLGGRAPRPICQRS